MLKTMLTFGAGATIGWVLAPKYVGGAIPMIIADSEAGETGSLSWVEFNYSGRYANDVFASCTISIEKPSRIIVVAVTHVNHTVQVTQIQRDGVDVTLETNIYVNSRMASGHLQYASELLPAGTYKYDVVFTPPPEIQEVAFCQCLIKAVAVG